MMCIAIWREEKNIKYYINVATDLLALLVIV